MTGALFRGEGRRLALLIGLICAVALFSVVMPLLFALTTDVLLPQGYRVHLLVGVGAVLALILTRFLLTLAQDYLFQKVRLRAERRMIDRFVRRIIRLPLPRAADEAASPDSRLRLWLVNFQYQFSELLFFYAYALFISLVVLAIILVVNPVIGALVLGFGVLHFLNFAAHNRAARGAAEAYSEAKAALVSDIAAMLAGKRAINLAGLDARIGATLRAGAADSFGAAYRLAAIANRQTAAQAVLRGALFVAILTLAAPMVRGGTLSVGGMFFTLLLVSFAYEPIYRLNRVTTLGQQLRAALRPLLTILAPLDRARATPVVLDRPLDEIVLRDVACRHGERPLFAGLNQRFVPGRLYLLAGPSGSGKSSLLDLIAGLAPADAGAVLWNACPVDQLGQAERARHAALAAQDSVLFTASIAQNVTIFAPDPDPARLRDLLRQLGLGARADDLDRVTAPDQFSLGERQRLGLARALYRPARLLLLDEPTANLDAASEELCLSAIAAAKRHRIVILVSHSARARALADEVILLEPSNA